MAKRRNLSKTDLSVFVEKNQQLIVEGSNKTIKEAIRAKYPNQKVHMPDLGLIAKLTVKYLASRIITQKIISNNDNISDDMVIKELTDIITTSGFLKLNIQNTDTVIQYIRTEINKKKLLSNVKMDDKSKLKEHIFVKIVEEETKELKHRIVQKEEEYNQSKKIWESISPSLKHLAQDNEELNIIEERPDEVEWWKEINLLKDPFNRVGLKDIPKDLYDEILINNDGVKFAKKFRQKEGGFVCGTNYLILGQFGTGKSVVLDYITKFALDRNIYSFTVRPITKPNSNAFFNSFIASFVNTQLNRTLKIHNLNITSPTEDGLFVGLDDLYQLKKYDGFICCVEDLHKQTNSYKDALDFINYLQSLHEMLNDGSFKTSFLLTGFPEWIDYIRDDSRLTSVLSVNDIIELPEVLPNIASQAINIRLNAFKLKDDQNSDIAVKYEYVQSLTHLINKSDRHTGYRLYFDEIKRKLINHEFDIFTINPTSLPKEINDRAHNIVKQHDVAYKIINFLLKRRIKEFQNNGMSIRLESEKIIKFFGHCILHSGISENDSKLQKKENKLILKHLGITCDALIYDKDNCHWVLNDYIRNLNNDLKKTLNIGLEHYVLSNYLFKSSKQKDLILYKRETEILKRLTNECVSGIETLYPDKSEIFKKIINQITEIVTLDDLTDGYKDITLIQAKTVIQKLLLNLLQIESPNLIRNTSPWFDWELRFEKGSYLYQFIKDYNMQSVSKFTDSKKKILIKSTLNTIEELLNITRETINISRVLRDISKTNHYNFSSLNQEVLHNLFKYFTKNNLNLHDLLHQELIYLFQSYLRILSSLIFGTYYDRKKIWLDCVHGETLECLKDEKHNTGEEFVEINEFASITPNNIFNNMDCDGGVFEKEIISPLIADFKANNIDIKMIIDGVSDNGALIIPGILNSIIRVTNLINDSILNNYTIIQSTVGEQSLTYSKLVYEEYRPFIENSILDISQISNVRAFCTRHSIKIWRVEQDIQRAILESVIGNTINFLDYENISRDFGNYNYSTAIVGFTYSLFSNELTSSCYYGNDHFVDLPKFTPISTRKDLVKLVSNLIESGENNLVEFKQTFRYNIATKNFDEKLKLGCVTAMSSFLNSDGGYLIIGIKDDGTSYGIDRDDYENADKYILAFRMYVESVLGKDAGTSIEVNITKYNSNNICLVKCTAHDKPVYLTIKDKEHFYVRLGPKNANLSISEAGSYIKRKFGK